MASPRTDAGIDGAGAYRLRTLQLGPMDNLVYVIEDQASRCAAVIDPAAMFHSLRMLSEQIPDEVSIHPGHHYAAQPSTTMAEQRRANPFLHFDAEAAFIAFRAEHNRHRLPPYRPIPKGMPAW